MICECVSLYKSKPTEDYDQLIRTALNAQSPICGIGRVALNDIQIDCAKVTAGDRVVLLTGYMTGEHFDDGTSIPLAFGVGKGKCIGYRIAPKVVELYLELFFKKYNPSLLSITDKEIEVGSSARNFNKLWFVYDAN